VLRHCSTTFGKLVSGNEYFLQHKVHNRIISGGSSLENLVHPGPPRGPGTLFPGIFQRRPIRLFLHSDTLASYSYTHDKIAYNLQNKPILAYVFLCFRRRKRERFHNFKSGKDVKN